VNTHDQWADIYDAMHTLTEDIPFYLDEAVKSGGPVLELGVGTGRVAIPIAQAGVNVVGIDHSPRMLEVAKRKAKVAGLSGRRLRLVQGDMRDFDLGQRFPLVIIPFRAFLHMYTVEDQRRCLHAIARHLEDGGRLALNVFVPRLDLLVDDSTPLAFRGDFTHPQTGRRVIVWHSREHDYLRQMIHEWRLLQELDEQGTVVSAWYLPLDIRYLFRYEAQHLFEGAGFAVEALYGGFDRRPFDEHSEEMVWVLRLR
jgi:ubiquinone/menaquinone biosynthesis C-methylase UbiE